MKLLTEGGIETTYSAVSASAGVVPTWVLESSYNLTTGSIIYTGGVSGTQLTSTIATGTAPLVVASTTPVANLSIGGNAATATTATNLAGGAGGTIPYQTAAGATTMLANGTAGQVLQSNGTTLAPSWVAASTGTVTAVSTAAANNGVTATWSMASPTPALTIGLGAITPTSISTSGQITSTIATGTAPFVITSTTPVANLSIGGNAATVTTDANLTGMVTSVGNAASLGSFTSANLSTALTDETGTGVAVFATSPTLVTPVIGAATGTSLSVTGQLTSTIATGTAPLVVTSTTVVGNLNVSQLLGGTWAIPGSIGAPTPGAGSFTT